jgi:hypothetical protein
MERLVRRLERLEREARLWRVATGVLLVGVAGLTPLVATSQTVPAQITAKRFVLVDDAGRRRAELHHLDVEPHGSTSLDIFDDRGRHSASFNVNQRVGGVHLQDEAEKYRIHMWGGDRPRLLLTGKDGFPRVMLLVSDDAPVVELRRPSGTVWKAP